MGGAAAAAAGCEASQQHSHLLTPPALVVLLQPHALRPAGQAQEPEHAQAAPSSLHQPLFCRPQFGVASKNMDHPERQRHRSESILSANQRPPPTSVQLATTWLGRHRDQDQHLGRPPAKPPPKAPHLTSPNTRLSLLQNAPQTQQAVLQQFNNSLNCLPLHLLSHPHPSPHSSAHTTTPTLSHTEPQERGLTQLTVRLSWPSSSSCNPKLSPSCCSQP